MSFKGFAFRTFFGGKPWYKSVTAWAQVVLAVGEATAAALAAVNALDPEYIEKMQAATRGLWAVMSALGIRRAVPNGTTTAALIACLLLPLGCNTLTVITQLPDKPPVTVEVKMAGRSCIAAEVDPSTGKVNIITQQDGTSDWIVGRILPALGSMALMAYSSIPLIGDAIEMPGPDDVAGCQGFFTNVLDTEEKDNPVYEIVPIVEGNDALIVR